MAQLIWTFRLISALSTGIGRATCVAVAKHGGHVIALSRTQADLDSLKNEVRYRFFINFIITITITSLYSLFEVSVSNFSSEWTVTLFINPDIAICHISPGWSYNLAQWLVTWDLVVTWPMSRFLESPRCVWTCLKQKWWEMSWRSSAPFTCWWTMRHWATWRPSQTSRRRNTTGQATPITMDRDSIIQCVVVVVCVCVCVCVCV